MAPQFPESKDQSLGIHGHPLSDCTLLSSCVSLHVLSITRFIHPISLNVLYGCSPSLYSTALS